MAEQRIPGPGEELADAKDKAAPARKAAIAIRYDVDRDKAPLVIASGRKKDLRISGSTAARM